MGFEDCIEETVEDERARARETTVRAEEARVGDGKDHWITLARAMIVAMAATDEYANRLLGRLACQSGYSPCPSDAEKARRYEQERLRCP